MKAFEWPGRPWLVNLRLSARLQAKLAGTAPGIYDGMFARAAPVT